MFEPTYRHAYHQTFVSKMMLADKADPAKDVTFEQALGMIRQVHRITGGVPHITYLTGWQHEGHDSKYPDFSAVNERLKRPQDRDGLSSLRWLIEAAREYNTTVSVHVNLCDAYKTSPLWDEYVREDLLVRTRTGELATGGVWGGEQSYWVSKAREWESGRTKQRLDALLELLPLERQGTMHIDVFSPNPSVYHGVTMAQEVRAMEGILLYLRSRGVDVTKEWFHHEFAGLVPMVYHLNLDEASRLRYPPSVICGGSDEWNSRANRSVFGNRSASATPEGGCLYEEAWGRSIDKDLYPGLKTFVGDFCTRTLPWLYLNRHRAIEHAHTERSYGVRFTGGVRTEVDTETRRLRMWCGDRLLLDGDDVCIPAAHLASEAASRLDRQAAVTRGAPLNPHAPRGLGATDPRPSAEHRTGDTFDDEPYDPMRRSPAAGVTTAAATASAKAAAVALPGSPLPTVEPDGPLPCMAFSRSGGRRTWAMGSDWDGVQRALVTFVASPGAAGRDAEPRTRELPVTANRLVLDLAPGQCAHVRGV